MAAANTASRSPRPTWGLVITRNDWFTSAWQASRQLWERRLSFCSSTAVRGLRATAEGSSGTSTKQVMH